MEDNSKEGGDDPKYENFIFYNHIVIEHNNGEYTECGYLKHKSIKCKIGDNVNIGEIIAQVGSIGYSGKTHLHFSVFLLEKMDLDFLTLPKNKKYFINHIPPLTRVVCSNTQL